VAFQTRLQLRTRARTRADQTNSTKPTDAEYNLFIDEACKKTWGELLTAGWNPGYTSTAFTANASLKYYPGSGATDILGIAGVYGTYAGQVYELRRLNQGDLAKMRAITTGQYSTHYEVSWDAANGLQVELFPHIAGGSYTVDYIPDHPGLANDATSWFGPARSDELIVLDVAAKALRNEGSDRDAWVLEKERDKLLVTCQTLASWIDMRNPAMIRDVGNSVSNPSFRDGFDYETRGA
jgi:hypothetical protein